MPQNKSYEDHDAQSSGMWSEFFCMFFVIAIGFPMQIGWVLNAWFGMSNVHLLELSAALGLLGGAYCAWESRASEKRKALRFHAPMESMQAVAGTELQQALAPPRLHDREQQKIVRLADAKGYGRWLESSNAHDDRNSNACAKKVAEAGQHELQRNHPVGFRDDGGDGVLRHHRHLK